MARIGRVDASYSLSGKERHVEYFDVLVDADSDNNFKWVADKNGKYPSCAVDIDNPDIRIGRAFPETNLISIGKVHAPHGCMYYPFKGKEIKIYNYEVLCTA